MKKMKKALMIALVFASLVFLTTGCAHNSPIEKRGYGTDLMQIQANAIPASAPTATSNDMSNLESKIDDMGNKIVAAIASLNQQTVATTSSERKSLPAGTFSQTAASTSATSKKVEKTVVYKTDTKLEERVARLEEIADYAHPGMDTVAVMFSGGEGTLSTAEQVSAKSHYNQWLNGEIDIKGMRGYASLAQPKKGAPTNEEIADQRLQNTVNYLRELGMDEPSIKEIRLEIVGETDRFPDGRRVSFLIVRIKDEAEIEKRQEARKACRLPENPTKK